MTMPALRDAPRLVLLLKSGPGSGAKLAHQAGYAFYGSPGRWHKITAEKPAPKGAPVAAHPEAAGKHAPAEHLAATEWQALALPESNVNAPSYNKALAKLKEWSDAGNVTAIVGAGYGSNTYGQKLAKIANHLLALHGSPHKVVAGQKAGTHAGAQAPAQDAAPQDAAGPYAKLADQLKAVLSSDMDAKVDAFVAALNSGADEQEAFDAAGFGAQAVAAQKVLAAKHGMNVVVQAPAAAPAPSAPGPLKMPAYTEANNSGAIALYEKVSQKIIDHGHAGNVSVLAGLPNPAKKMWQGKTPNSKKLLALHAEAMAYAKGETKPAAATSTQAMVDSIAQSSAAPEHKAAAIDAVVKQGAASVQAKTNLSMIPWDKQILPDSNSNAGSHNKAVNKIKAMAEAGDKAGLQAFIDGKAGAKQTYAKKQVLLAQTALAALGGEATAAVPLQQPPAPTPAQPPAAATEPEAADKYLLVNAWKQALADGKHPTKEQAEAYEALVESDPDAAMEYFMDAVNANVPAGDFTDDKFDDALQEAHQKVHSLHGEALFGKVPAAPEPAPADGLTQTQIDAIEKIAGLSDGSLEALVDSPGLPENVNAAIKKKLAEKQAAPAQAPAAPKTATAPKTTLHNTLPGHSKSWSVHVAPNASGGFDMVTEYGKIGGTQQKTVKSFATADEAHAEKKKLINSKEAKGYSVVDTDYGHKVVVPAAVEQGPKEGDTKQGADGLLVLKDGHWVKMGEGDPNAAQWDYDPSDMAMSGAATLTSEGDNGATFYIAHDGETFQVGKMDPSGDVSDDYQDFAFLSDAVLYMKDNLGGSVPPLESLQKLDKNFKASDMPSAKAAPPQTPAASAPPLGTPEPMDSWVQTGGQGGSNPGGKFKDANGQEWYVKWPDDADAVKSEVLAAKLYGLAGLSSQDAKLVTKGGKTAIASKWVNIKKAGSAAALAGVDGVLQGFAVDAWLGNWDVVGLSLDNLQIGPDGKAHRVDAGGSLEYRAQGEKKPFGATVDEIDTLRDAAKNAKAAAVFGKMTKADIVASVAKVAAIEDSAIRAMVFEHGPGDEAAKKKLADTLIARKEDLLKRYPEAAKAKKKALDPAALPVDPKTLPKPHDFENWNGPGKGLSSKDYVNKANAVAEYQMLALAQAGNMVALRDFKFQEVDKNTGAPTGKLLPISQHPSKHVLQYQQDLLQVLDEVANPPEPLKVFRSTEVGSLEALNAAFPPKKFGTTVAKVASNEKLGFWIALGAVGNPEKFKPKKVSNYAAAAIEAAKAKYQKASKLAKHFISSVQASGSYNDLFRDGKTQDHQGNSLKDVAKAALEHATEMPEGTSVYRWQKMSPQMLEHIMSAKDGTVFQATGPMCTSYSPTATKGFGTHRVTIRYAKGAKAVESFASGGFASEKEVTTLPNARFVILSKQMVPDVEHGNPSSKRLELEILMLPPDLGI